MKKGCFKANFNILLVYLTLPTSRWQRLAERFIPTFTYPEANFLHPRLFLLQCLCVQTPTTVGECMWRILAEIKRGVAVKDIEINLAMQLLSFCNH